MNLTQLDIGTLVLISTGTALVTLLGFLFIGCRRTKVALLAGVTGLAIYSGVGGAYPEVSKGYILKYAIYCTTMVAGFVITTRTVALKKSQVYKMATSLERPEVWRIAAFLYLLCLVTPFLFPSLRLGMLLSPKAPDLSFAVERTFVPDVGHPALLASYYISLLLFPFFLLDLGRREVGTVTFLTSVVTPAYLIYCQNNYIARSDLLQISIFILYFFWTKAAWKRRYKILMVGAASVAMIVLFAYYQEVRAGAGIRKTPEEMVSEMITIEVSFPVVAEVVINSGARADTSDFFIWLFTLPIPKAIIGAVRGGRYNYEITELVSGRSVDGEGGSVVLAGVIAEAVYIFGGKFFWIHALVYGCVFAFACALVSKIEKAKYVYLSIIIIFGYFAMRAGIGPALSSIINRYLLLFLVLVGAIFTAGRGRSIVQRSLI